MALTKVNCTLTSRFEGANEGTYQIFNPRRHPGSLVMNILKSDGGSMVSQVTSTMAMQEFSRAIIEGYEDIGAISNAENNLRVLEQSFRKVNSHLYNSSQQMTAAGKMSCSLLSCCIEDGVASAGRVGSLPLYLLRDGGLFPFFDSLQNGVQSASLGIQPIVRVELASVDLLAGDEVVMCVTAHHLNAEKEMTHTRRVIEALDEELPIALDVRFALLASVGPETVFLAESLAQSERYEARGS